MIAPYDPLKAGAAWARLLLSYAQMSTTAGEVIVRRTMKMAQGSMTAAEALGMVMEKATAFAAATEGATSAAVNGGDPVRIARAALRPIHVKARSNVRELRR